MFQELVWNGRILIYRRRAKYIGGGRSLALYCGEEKRELRRLGEPPE